MDLTPEEAASVLRRYRRDIYLDTSKPMWRAKRDPDFQRCVYGRFLIGELIRKIQYSQKSPVQVVTDLYAELDFVLGESDEDHFVTHQFAASMEFEAGNILQYLKRVERMKNDYAQNQLEGIRTSHPGHDQA